MEEETPSPEVLPEDQQEDFADLSLKPRWYFGPVLWSTDWTTQTIISQLDRGNINLNPRFQRRNAWSAEKKSLFIESLILGLPIPQIILAEDHRRKGSFIVIDGKQRLLTLRQFMAQAGEDFHQLVLTGLEDRTDLNGRSFADLQDDLTLVEDRNSFENQTIRTVVIRNWKEDKYLYSVFLRINTGSVQLSPQELRQALYPGPFSDFIDDFSASSKALKQTLGLKEPDFRMRDVELVLRYFAYQLFAGDYSGDIKGFLDNTADLLNRNWPQERDRVIQMANRLNDVIEITRIIFGAGHEFRKWNGKAYERRINRAVFDIMSYYFSEPQIAGPALENAGAVKKAFENACAEDNKFRSSLESTTKSTDQNIIRFRTWAEILSGVLGFKIQPAM